MNENTRNIITTIATIIAIVCAVLNCILTAISVNHFRGDTQMLKPPTHRAQVANEV